MKNKIKKPGFEKPGFVARCLVFVFRGEN